MRRHASPLLAALSASAIAAVQALRISPLSLAARESMKVTGASRRSAAPGSQFGGVAECGDDSCAFQQSSSTRTNRTIRGAHPIHARLQIAFRLWRLLALAREQRHTTVAVTTSAPSQDNASPLPARRRSSRLRYPSPKRGIAAAESALPPP
jgi:hypothetical protein